jgi:hypothetical protein
MAQLVANYEEQNQEKFHHQCVQLKVPVGRTQMEEAACNALDEFYTCTCNFLN